MKNIFIVGSINTDLVINSPYVPKAGETLTGSGFFTAHGGKGANQAVAAARLGGNVHFCGVVGNDSYGELSIKSLKEEGINVDHVRVDEGESSGVAMIVVVKGDNRIILNPGANAKLTKEDIDSFLEDSKPGDIFLTQLENPIPVIGYGLKKAKFLGLKTVLNPAPASVDIIPYLKYCDIITPNETEVEILGGIKKLRELVPEIVMTMGGDGYAIVKGQGISSYPCTEVDVVDTTAAGDTLSGGMVSKLASGESLEAATEFGCLAASIACTRKGAQPSIPTLKEVEKFNK